MNQLLAPPELAAVRRARHAVLAARRSYRRRRAVAVLLPAAAAGGLLAMLDWHWPAGWPAWAGAAAAGLWWAGARLWPLRRLGPAAITRLLDRRFPELEDSAGLLWHAPEHLTLLEQLQQQRVAARLPELAPAPQAWLPVNLRRPAGAALVLLLGSAVVAWLEPASEIRAPVPVAVRFATVPAAAQKSVAPARISETRLWVMPPAYTRLAAFAPAQASFACPQGSRVRWQVCVSGGGPAASRPMPALEIGQQRRLFRPVAGAPGAYFTELTLTASALYRLRLGGTVSDDYAIAVRADQAPAVRILAPGPYTLVAFGQRPAVPVRAAVRDDYGLSRAELVITVAQGQGEAVKFREVRRDLSAGLGGQPAQATLASQLDLPRLGLTYGDELYFYVAARDNAGHAARSAAHLVQWQDTAVATGASDLGMGVKVAPAYFRSQRQVIIDTEKLLAERARLDPAALARRANDLGIDQQALRLRYGKFMGEELEPAMGAAPPSPIAEDDAETDHSAHEAAEAPHDEHDHGGGAAALPANASPTAATDALLEPYVHRHDDAETADFLEPAVKAKLAAVLSQMWAAELRLRTAQPAAALPYEYRALRLLKQVQQQTRAYVKKAGFVPPPLPEATLRLTGELAGAAAPRRHTVSPAPADQPAARAALHWLATHPTTARPDPAAAQLLERAGAGLAGAALRQPGPYLPALRALRQLVNDVRAGRPACAACRPPVVRALTDLLAAPTPVPVPAPAPDRLAQRYFQELDR